MKSKVNKSLNYYIRALHRDIGFLIIGFTLIFCVSGFLLVLRETDFLKKEQIVEKTLEPNMESSAIGQALHLRDFQILKEEGNVLYFQNGNYDKLSGKIRYSTKELPSFLNRLNNFHKTSNKNITHWFTLIYSIALLFLAISSFLMYRTKSKMFRRGIVFASIGFVIAAIVIFFL